MINTQTDKKGKMVDGEVVWLLMKKNSFKLTRPYQFEWLTVRIPNFDGY